MTIGSAVAALPIVIWARLPSAASWPYILMSVALHAGYNLFLVCAYRAGDFGQSYPIARSSSPLLVSLGAGLLAGEKLGMLTLVGVALTFAGIISLAQISFGRGKTENCVPRTQLGCAVVGIHHGCVCRRLYHR